MQQDAGLPRAETGLGLLDRLAHAIVTGSAARPRTVLGVLAALTLLAALAAARLGVDTDSSRMLAPDLPFQERAQEIVRAFPEVKNTVVVVVRGPHRDAVDATVGALAAGLAARAEAEGSAISSVFAPSADPFLTAHGLLYQNRDALEAQLSRLSQSANLLAELRENRDTEGFLTALGRAVTLAERADFDTAALERFMGEAADVFAAAREGRARPFDWSSAMAVEAEEGLLTRVVSVQPALDFTRLNPARPAIEAVEAEIAALDPGLAALVEIGLTGDPVLRADELRSVTATLGLSLGLSLLLVAGVLFLALGRAARVGLALATVLVTLVLTAGFAGLAIGALNLVSVAFVVLMVGLGIDYAIHLLAHIDEDTERGLDTRAALGASARSIGGALGLSAATTALAFGAFTVTDFVGMAQLGAIGAAGVVFALLVALTMIPAAVALRPSLARGRGPLDLPRTGNGAGWAAAAAALAVGIAAAVVAPSARFDADPMGLRNPAAPSVVAYGWLTEDPVLAPLRLSLLVPDAEAAEAAAVRLETVPGVRSATWLGDLVPRDQEAKLDQIDLAYPSIQFAVEGEAVELADEEAVGPLAPRLRALGLPEADALAVEVEALKGPSPALDAALFRFFPLLIDRLALQLEAGPVTVAELPAPLVSRFRAEDGTLRVEIAAEENLADPAARRAFVDAVAAEAPEAGGPPAQIEGAASAVGGAMALAAALALGGTVVLSWLVLRSAGQVLAILVPMAVAGAVTMAASVLLDMPFNYANIIVLPLMIGIGVDAGVHLAIRTANTAAAVWDSSTPRAVMASALTTIAAFATLAVSDHRGTASMGVMLAIALVASVVAILALTPPLVRLSMRRNDPGGA